MVVSTFFLPGDLCIEAVVSSDRLIIFYPNSICIIIHHLSIDIL